MPAAATGVPAPGPHLGGVTLLVPAVIISLGGVTDLTGAPALIDGPPGKVLGGVTLLVPAVIISLGGVTGLTGAPALIDSPPGKALGGVILLNCPPAGYPNIALGGVTDRCSCCMC